MKFCEFFGMTLTSMAIACFAAWVMEDFGLGICYLIISAICLLLHFYFKPMDEDD